MKRIEETPYEAVASDEEDSAARAKKQSTFQRIKCAECHYCKMTKETNRNGRYVLKARCAKGHWFNGRKETRTELFRLGARQRSHCPDYRSTSDNDQDRKRFIRDLDDFLPLERHIYNPDGSFVDKTETMRWSDDT